MSRVGIGVNPRGLRTPTTLEITAIRSPSPSNAQERQRPALRREALHTQVLDKLRRLIANGDIPAGERLNELQIAASFRVSRTPIREAVKLLASEGLLELLPGRGARVRRLTRQEILESFEVIGALERHAVESVVRRMSERQRKELTTLQTAMTRAFEIDDPSEYFDYNQKVHRFFVRAAGNTTLAALHDAITKRARRERPLTLASAPRWTASMTEHADIVAAALDGAAERAGAAMLDHLRRTGEAMADKADDGIGE